MTKTGIGCCLLFLLAFGLYLHRTFPSVSVGDSGEFMTAADTLGIPHASGFPSYTVLAKCFMSVEPLGNPGFRVNLFSAAAGALTVSVLFLILRFLGISNAAAIFGALLYMIAASQTAISQATEVFALHLLFMSLCLLSLIQKRWMLFGLLFGLGLGDHQTLLLLFPAFLVGLYLSEGEFLLKDFLKPALFAGLGLLIYGVLYVRAAKDPFLNVGHADTLPRLWRVITRADYGSLTLSLGETPARTLGNGLRQLERFLQGVRGEISWAGLFLSMLGTFFWFKRDRRVAGIVAITFLLTGPFFFWLGNLPFDSQSTGLLRRFYAAPTFCLIFFAAGFVQMISEKYKTAAWLFLLLPAILFSEQGEATNFRNAYEAYAYGRNTLRSLPPRTIFIMDGGDDTFYTTAYLTQAEKRRPDLELHDRGGVVFASAYCPDFRSLTHDEKELRRQTTERLLAQSGAPLFYSTMNPGILRGTWLAQQGLVYSANSPVNEFMWEFYDLRGIAPWMARSSDPVADYRLRALLPFYAYQRGVSAAYHHAWDDAIGFMESSRAVGFDVLWLAPNISMLTHLWAFQALQLSDLALSRKLYEFILRWDPKDDAAWTNLGATEERFGILSAALDDYKKAADLAPQSAAAHFNLASALWKQGRWSEAAGEFNAVLSIDPNYLSARHFLELAQHHAQ